MPTQSPLPHVTSTMSYARKDVLIGAHNVAPKLSTFQAIAPLKQHGDMVPSFVSQNG